MSHDILVAHLKNPFLRGSPLKDEGEPFSRKSAAFNRAVEPLCTANDKHYKSIPGIALDVFRS